ncbi:MAG: DUF3179 domain-containing protein [Verrucomicrobiales bacterium]|nr:DUF3179 domain-containing protein [Verrucomicrobiales bacterium]
MNRSFLPFIGLSQSGFLLLLFLLVLPEGSRARNGFNLTKAIIPIDEIFQGGPPRDGIPSIDAPAFEKVDEADWLKDEDLIVAVEVGDEQRAYPLRILVWHEIVNDTVGGTPLAITYCPLCGTAMTFSRVYDGKTLTFGVSGLLYQSDVLMYDRETESLWSQLAMKSLSGKFVEEELKWIPSRLQTWKSWKAEHPRGKVLSRKTGFQRDYDRMPYEGYEDRPETIFPVPEHRKELGNKEWILGVRHGDASIALPEKSLTSVAENGSSEVEIEVGGKGLLIQYKVDSRAAKVTDRATGNELPVVHVYWFAWQAFYPDTTLWQP